MENKLSEQEQALEEFKGRWIGCDVKIIGFDHPHFLSTGKVSSVDYTNVGFGMKVDLQNGESCYVFKGSDIKKI